MLRLQLTDIKTDDYWRLREQDTTSAWSKCPIMQTVQLGIQIEKFLLCQTQYLFFVFLNQYLANLKWSGYHGNTSDERQFSSNEQVHGAGYEIQPRFYNRTPRQTQTFTKVTGVSVCVNIRLTTEQISTFAGASRPKDN